MVAPITPCEHCKTVLRVPLMPGSPTSGHMKGGEITCSNCGKQTRVNEAFILADPQARPGEVSYKVPAVCTKCHHRFPIDMGPPKREVPEGQPQPVDMAYAKLVVDVGEDSELVTVRSVTATTFTAKFLKAHPSSGYPVALMGGHARLRLLLGQADTAWQALQDPSVGATAGLKQVDKGDVEWFQGFQVLKDRLNHYKAIVMQISSLVRVAPCWDSVGSSQLEAY